MSQSVGMKKIYGKLSNRVRVRERQGEIINMAFEAMKQYDLGLFRRYRLMVFIGFAIKSLKAWKIYDHSAFLIYHFPSVNVSKLKRNKWHQWKWGYYAFLNNGFNQTEDLIQVDFTPSPPPPHNEYKLSLALHKFHLRNINVLSCSLNYRWRCERRRWLVRKFCDH